MMNPDLDRKLRENTGKGLRGKFYSSLAALGDTSSINTLSLVETDNYINLLRASAEKSSTGEVKAFRETFPADEKDKVRAIFLKLAAKYQRDAIVLVRSLSQYCGAIEIEGQRLFEHALELVTPDQEDLIFCRKLSPSDAGWLSLDSDNSEGAYTLTLCGDFIDLVLRIDSILE